MRKAAILLIILVVIVIGYISLNEGSKLTGKAVAAPISDTPKPSGSFELLYTAPQNSSFNGIYQDLQQNNIFASMVSDLNSHIKLPSDVWIMFSQCNSPDAFYDSSQKLIRICYEFISNMERLYAASNAQNAEFAAINYAEFALYHEVGHALIDNLNLPVTGKEEDASDQLAVLFSKDTPVLFAASAMALQASAVPAWDEHSLDSQRFYNIMCWLYGENQTRYPGITGILPHERAQRCSSEYAKMLSSWSRLLGPYLKN